MVLITEVAHDLTLDLKADVVVRANWQVASYTNDRGPVLRNGHYEFVLVGGPGEFRIAHKKILMLEEKMESFIDFYSV